MLAATLLYASHTALAAGTAALQPLSDDEADTIVADQMAPATEAEGHFDEAEIIQSQQIELDGRRLIFNRVTPPSYSVASFTQPTALTKAIGEAVSVLSVEEEGEAPLNAKEQESLFVTAQVYDQIYSVLDWQFEGEDFRAYSNVDFNDLAGTLLFETETTVYTTLLVVNEMDSQAIESRNQELLAQGYPESSLMPLPNWPPFTEGEVEFFVESLTGTNEPSVDAYRGLLAIHAHYAQNKSELAVKRQRREALQAARERYEQANPPAPKPDTVIHFWRLDTE
ncbi:MAG: hypothetical protein ACFBZ8_11245 [Opitutales bacterium]